MKLSNAFTLIARLRHERTSFPPSWFSHFCPPSLAAVLSVSLVVLVIPGTSLAGNVSLAWDASTDANLMGYRVYYGTASRLYGQPLDAGLNPGYVVQALAPGTYYFAVTAYDAAGMESGYSNEVVAVISPVDTSPPLISITSPTSAASFATNLVDLNLGGTASDNVGVAGVTWSNGSGGSGAAAGTASWTADVHLVSGTNNIVVTARDAAGNSASDTISVTCDTIAPAIGITIPTSASTYVAPGSLLSIGGTASDNVGVSQIAWSNSAGGAGLASGTASWTASGISLAIGLNVITVSARDVAGNSASATLSVTYAPDNTPPTISSVQASAITQNGATIAWVTDESADSEVEHGTSASYGSTTGLKPSLVKSHSVTLSGLSPGTTYYFRVRSRDAAGNLASSPDFNFATGSSAGGASGLAAAYGFDEGTGSTTSDSSGNSGPATLSGVSWTSSAKFGKALSFNGTSAYVLAQCNGLPPANEAQTVSFWAYQNSRATGTQAAVSIANSTQASGVQVGFRNFQVGAWQYGGNWLVAAPQARQKSWHHYAYTFDGLTHRFYVDGGLSSTSTVSAQGAIPTTFQMGRWINGSAYFKGTLDEVRIYSRALGQSEIQALMKSSVVGLSSLQSGGGTAASLEGALSDASSLEARLSDGASEGDAPRMDQTLLSPDRSELVENPAQVNIRMSQQSYGPDEAVIASTYRLSNPAQRERSIELKTWLTAPREQPLSIGNAGPDGLYVFPAGLDEEYGPVTLLHVGEDAAEGIYEFGARLLDPVTGDPIAEDIRRFYVSAASAGGRRNGPSDLSLRENQVVNIDARPASAEYYFGDIVSLADFKIENTGLEAAQIELKVWLEAPGRNPIPLFSMGENGMLVLPPGSDMHLDPLPAFAVSAKIPGGIYVLRSRALDPATGKVVADSSARFVIR